ncbi:sugar ABC transporter permease protein [Cutibacterium acnes JCM 18918]|nr:sugar ABC transporter permease protein [Cutibacterium acnes JCM 18918]
MRRLYRDEFTTYRHRHATDELHHPSVGRRMRKALPIYAALSPYFFFFPCLRRYTDDLYPATSLH